MHIYFSAAFASLALVTSIAAAPFANTTGQELRADQDPVFHLYLQNHNGSAVLGPESSDLKFDLTASGGSVSTSSTSSAPGLFLNIGSETTSYKTLPLGSSPGFSNWALEGDTLITAQTSSYGRQLNFLVCESTTAGSGFWDVWLQTGSDTPSGRTCANYITLHLPCLC